MASERALAFSLAALEALEIVGSLRGIERSQEYACGVVDASVAVHDRLAAMSEREMADAARAPRFWFVAYRTTRDVDRHQAANVLLAGLHPVVWLSGTHEFGVTGPDASRRIDWFIEIDEATFDAAVAQNAVNVEDFRVSDGTH